MRSDYAEESHGDKARPRHGSPIFYALLQEMAETHDRKSHDYASDQNPTGNYRFAGEMALVFKHSSMDAGFFGRIAEKIYRLANLESSGRTPKNETVEDTERDICVITALWMADRRDRRSKEQANQAQSWGMDRPDPEFDVRDVEQIHKRSQEAVKRIIELYTQLTVSDTLQVAQFFAGCQRDIQSQRSAQLGETRADNAKRL